MTEENPNNRHEIKSDIFSWKKNSNLTPYCFLTNYVKVLQCLLKLKFLNFTTKVNPNNGNETK